MKTILLAFCLVLVVCSTHGQGQTRPFSQALDDKYGFRDLRFGVPKSEIAGLLLVGADGDNSLYKRASDDLQIGEAAVSSITYCFYKDKFYAVQIAAPAANFNALLSALSSAYGKPYVSNKYRWRGNTAGLTLEESPATHDATAFMFSIALLADKAEQERLKASSKPVKGL